MLCECPDMAEQRKPLTRYEHDAFACVDWQAVYYRHFPV
jgi:hypothetical protein